MGVLPYHAPRSHKRHRRYYTEEEKKKKYIKAGNPFCSAAKERKKGHKSFMAFPPPSFPSRTRSLGWLTHNNIRLFVSALTRRGIAPKEKKKKIGGEMTAFISACVHTHTHRCRWSFFYFIFSFSFFDLEMWENVFGGRVMACFPIYLRSLQLQFLFWRTQEKGRP